MPTNVTSSIVGRSTTWKITIIPSGVGSSFDRTSRNLRELASVRTSSCTMCASNGWPSRVPSFGILETSVEKFPSTFTCLTIVSPDTGPPGDGKLPELLFGIGYVGAGVIAALGAADIAGAR